MIGHDPAFGQLLTSHCLGCSVRDFGFALRQRCGRCFGSVDVVRVPCSLVGADQALDSVLLKPSVGSFLWDYQFGNDLHIGLSTKQGYVVSYDKNGLQIDHSGQWQQCLKLLDGDDIAVDSAKWNLALERSFLSPQWTANEYSQNRRNCFDFVLQHLNNVANEFLTYDKSTFVQCFIQKPLIRLAKFIRIYRRCFSCGIASFHF